MHLYYMAGLSDRLRDYVGNNDNSFHNGYEKMRQIIEARAID